MRRPARSAAVRAPSPVAVVRAVRALAAARQQPVRAQSHLPTQPARVPMLPDHAAQLAAHRRRDQLRSEARSARRLRHARPAALDPSQRQRPGRRVQQLPGHLHPPGRHRQRAMAGRVGGQLVQHHRERAAPHPAPAARAARAMRRARRRGRDRVPPRRRHPVRHRSSPPWQGECAAWARTAIRPSTASAKARGFSARVSRTSDSATASAFLARWSTSRASMAWRSSARLRAVTSRVIARCAKVPSASLRGVAWVSMLRRVPRRPTTSNSQRSASPRQTRSWFARHAARCSGAIRSKAHVPSACGPPLGLDHAQAGFVHLQQRAVTALRA